MFTDFSVNICGHANEDSPLQKTSVVNDTLLCSVAKMAVA